MSKIKKYTWGERDQLMLMLYVSWVIIFLQSAALTGTLFFRILSLLVAFILFIIILIGVYTYFNYFKEKNDKKK